MKPPKLKKEIFDISIGKFIKINIWTIPMFVFSTLGDYGDIFLLAYISSALHELAHIICARALSVDISYIKIYPFGITARLKSEYIRSSEKEFWISAAGPLCSMILFWCFAFLKSLYSTYLFSFLFDINFAICCINLLPCLPLDGGRMLKSILTVRFGIIRAYKYTLSVSKIILALLVVFAISLIFVSKFNFSLVLISAFLLQNLAFEQQVISVITLREILSNRQKSEFSERLPAKILCVHENRPASGILRHFTYDCFYIVNVMNKDSKIISTLTEVEVLDSLLKNGIRTKYRDIIAATPNPLNK